MLRLNMGAKIMLTDSGGLQEGLVFSVRVQAVEIDAQKKSWPLLVQQAGQAFGVRRGGQKPGGKAHLFGGLGQFREDERVTGPRQPEIRSRRSLRSRAQLGQQGGEDGREEAARRRIVQHAHAWPEAVRLGQGDVVPLGWNGRAP